jgi:hypothetical protein
LFAGNGFLTFGAIALAAVTVAATTTAAAARLFAIGCLVFFTFRTILRCSFQDGGGSVRGRAVQRGGWIEDQFFRFGFLVGLLAAWFTRWAWSALAWCCCFAVLAFTWLAWLTRWTWRTGWAASAFAFAFFATRTGGTGFAFFTLATATFAATVTATWATAIALATVTGRAFTTMVGCCGRAAGAGSGLRKLNRRAKKPFFGAVGPVQAPA